MRIRLPGYIQINRAPEGEGGGGASPSPAPSSPSPAPASSAGAAPSSPSGASPSPSPSPAPAASPAAPTAPSSPAANPTPLPEDPFAGFGAVADDDDEPLGALPTPPVPAEAGAPVDPKAKPPEGQQPPPAAAAPAQPTPTPAHEQPGPQGTAPQLPSPAEPLKISQALLADIDGLTEHLAQTQEFRLSEADIEAINTDVVTAVPKLLARTFVRAQASAMAQMDRVVPAMIDRYLKVDRARGESEAKFYSKWPALNKASHGKMVDRYAATYRQMNPTATMEQMIDDLGPVIMAAAKVQPVVAAPQNGSGLPQTGARKTPPAPPFQPAVGGSAAPPATEAPDPWGGYGAPSLDEE